MSLSEPDLTHRYRTARDAALNPKLFTGTRTFRSASGYYGTFFESIQVLLAPKNLSAGKTCQFKIKLKKSIGSLATFNKIFTVIEHLIHQWVLRSSLLHFGSKLNYKRPPPLMSHPICLQTAVFVQLFFYQNTIIREIGISCLTV
jgi:hypothetical protein